MCVCLHAQMESSAAMATAGDLMKVATVAHYLDPPQSHTADLSRLLDDLPQWTTPVAWSAIYKEWIF